MLGRAGCHGLRYSAARAGLRERTGRRGRQPMAPEEPACGLQPRATAGVGWCSRAWSWSASRARPTSWPPTPSSWMIGASSWATSGSTATTVMTWTVTSERTEPAADDTGADADDHRYDGAVARRP